jgi:hypothetical protein
VSHARVSSRGLLCPVAAVLVSRCSTGYGHRNHALCPAAGLCYKPAGKRALRPVYARLATYWSYAAAYPFCGHQGEHDDNIRSPTASNSPSPSSFVARQVVYVSQSHPEPHQGPQHEQACIQDVRVR